MYHIYVSESTKEKLDKIALKFGINKRKAAEYCIHSVFENLDSLSFSEEKSSGIETKLDLILSRIDEISRDF